MAIEAFFLTTDSRGVGNTISSFRKETLAWWLKFFDAETPRTKRKTNMAYYQAPEPNYYSNEEVVDISNPYSNGRRDVTLTYNPSSGQFPSYSVNLTEDLNDFKSLTVLLNVFRRFPRTERTDNKHKDYRRVR